MKTFGKILLAILSPWTSRKLWMTIIGVAVVQGLFWAGVWYLYSFTEQWRAELFVKMYTSAAWTISMMMLGYLGLQTLATGWTNATASATTSLLSSVFEKKEEKIEQIITIRHEGGAKAFADDIP